MLLTLSCFSPLCLDAAAGQEGQSPSSDPVMHKGSIHQPWFEQIERMSAGRVIQVGIVAGAGFSAFPTAGSSV